MLFLGNVITALVLLITYNNVLKNTERLYDILQVLPYAPDPSDQLGILLAASNNNKKIQFTVVWQSLLAIHKVHPSIEAGIWFPGYSIFPSAPCS